MVDVVAERPAPYFSDGSISTLSPLSCQGSAKANSTKLDVETKKPFYSFHNTLIYNNEIWLPICDTKLLFFQGKDQTCPSQVQHHQWEDRRVSAECLFICSMWIIWLSSQTNLIRNWSRVRMGIKDKMVLGWRIWLNKIKLGRMGAGIVDEMAQGAK